MAHLFKFCSGQKIDFFNVKYSFWRPPPPDPVVGAVTPHVPFPLHVILTEQVTLFVPSVIFVLQVPLKSELFLRITPWNNIDDGELNLFMDYWTPDLAYADDVNILGGSIHTLKENAEALVAATREIGLEANADKTKYMVMSRDQNAGRIHSVRIGNSTFERVRV